MALVFILWNGLLHKQSIKLEFPLINGQFYCTRRPKHRAEPRGVPELHLICATKGLSALSLLGKGIIFLARLGRIRFLARLRVFTVFVISITSLKKAVIITVAPRHFFFLFGLNSTSFHSKLIGKWSAAFKTSSENVKLMGRRLVSQATGIGGRVTKLSLPCLAPHRLHTK